MTKNDHRYLKNEEMREEGGTPAIVESIRAGLVFQLKNAIGTHAIMERERFLVKLVVSGASITWKQTWSWRSYWLF